MKPSVIVQTQKTEDKSTEGEFSCAILKNKFCNSRGKYKVDFLALNQGKIGIIFKYKDKNNYYLLIISGGDDVKQKYFAIKKKISGLWSLVEQKTSIQELSAMTFIGYETNKWYNVEIEFTIDAQIYVKIGILNVSPLNLVFKLNDNEIKYGEVGVCSYATQGVFSELSLNPHMLQRSNIFALKFKKTTIKYQVTYTITRKLSYLKSSILFTPRPRQNLLNHAMLNSFIKLCMKFVSLTTLSN